MIKQMGILTSGQSIGVPDYTKRESRTKNTTYTAAQDGWVYIYTRGGDTSGGLNATVTINGVAFKQAYRHNDYGASAASIMLPVKTGDTYRLSGAIDSMEMWFIPPMGGGVIGSLLKYIGGLRDELYQAYGTLVASLLRSGDRLRQCCYLF